jgi:SMC interacting uncharacterized protein involved in chromosome segregation
MTFQEAQAQFSTITARAKANMPSGDLVQVQRDLITLQGRLPDSPEFDVIANAIDEFSPKLTGQIAQAVLDSLKSRDSAIREASALLTQVANKAQNNARALNLEQPKLIAAGLTEAVTKIQELRDATKARDVETAASKVEALATLVQYLQSTIKEA